MGIPNLWSFLASHAIRRTITRRVANNQTPSNSQSNDLTGISQGIFGVESSSATTAQDSFEAVIDGPSLAYQAFFNVLKRKPPTIGLDNIPTYKETNNEVLRWLDALEDHGLKIARIFFDGALPESKRDTRRERLQRAAEKMAALRQMYPGARIDTSKSLKALQQNLQPWPFMVPSVIECLLQSRYASRVRVVPAEADVYCAAYARQHGGLIFTSDSDLLVHDSGERSGICGLLSVEQVVSGQESTISWQQLNPSTIAMKFGLRNLTSLGFVLVERGHHDDKTVNLAKVVEQNSEIDSDETKRFKAFAAEYIADTKLLSDVSVSSPSRQLDPRVSEWIQQMSMPSRGDSEEHPHMYLPALQEDFQFASAWVSGIEIRKTAYSLFQPSDTNDIYRTLEHYRKGQHVARDPVEHATSGQCLQLLRDLAGLYLRLADEMAPITKDCPKDTFWRVYAVTYVVKRLLADGKQLPSRENLSKLLWDQDTSIDWTLIHLNARVQAVLYSLRMLEQILDAPDSTKWMQCINADLRKKLRSRWDQMLQRLKSMPSLEVMFPANSNLRAEQREGVLGIVHREVGLPAVPVQVTKKQVKANKLAAPRGVAGATQDPPAGSGLDQNNGRKVRSRSSEKRGPQVRRLDAPSKKLKSGPFRNSFAVLADNE